MAINYNKLLFHVIFWSAHLAIFVFGFFKQKNDPELFVLNSIGPSVFVSRGAGLVLSVDCALVVLPVCRIIISSLKLIPTLSIPLENAIYMHKWAAYAILIFTTIHTYAHYVNFFFVERKLPQLNLKDWMVHYTTFAGTTGHIMLIAMFLMYAAAQRSIRKSAFETFWYIHHLFMIFYICLFLHSKGCFVKSAFTGQCKGYNSNYATIPAFCIYIIERIYREYRSSLRTIISKVILHPGNTIELHIEKPSFHYIPGQYLYINVPSISYFQWHPFTITSAPEDGFISVHIRIVGDWTRSLASLLNCTQPSDTPIGFPKQPRSVPFIRIDGPYGAPAQDLPQYPIAIMIGAGIGVTPSASHLKSIYHKHLRPTTTSSLNKLYFIWITRSKHDFEWFQSLLSYLEATFPPSFLDTNLYLTDTITKSEIINIMVNDTIHDTDPITSLKSRTMYGRPDFARIFLRARNEYLAKYEDASDASCIKIGVFCCGSDALCRSVDQACVEMSTLEVQFVMRKERF